MVISVVTPSYNQGVFIERTIKSVLDQSGDFFIEYFIADGGSTDTTIEIIRDYESRIKRGAYPILCRGIEFSWVSEKDRGQADAVNKGIEATSGDIIAWINSDDMYYPNAFSTVAAFFRDNPSALVAYGPSDHIDEKDRVIGPYPTEPWDYDRLFEACFLCQPGVFFRRQLVNQAGLLDPNLQFCMDYELWLRYGRFTNFCYLQEKLAGSRLYENTKTLGQAVAVHNEINDMFKARLGKVPRRSIYTFARIVAQQLEKTCGSRKGNLDTIREIAQDAFLKWWGFIPSDELDHMDRFLSEPNTSSWQGKKSLEGLDELRIGIDLRRRCQDARGSKKLGSMIANLMARGNPERQFLVYDFSTPNIAQKGTEETFYESGLKNVHHVPVLHVDLHSVNHSSLDTCNFAATLGFPDILLTDNIKLINLPNVKIVSWVTEQMFVDNLEYHSNSESGRCFGITDQVVRFADMVIVYTELQRKNFLERYPEFPVNRIVTLNLITCFEDKAKEFAEKLLEVYEQVSRLPKRTNSVAAEVITEPPNGSFYSIYRAQKKASLTNQTIAWFIRLAEKNATTKNRLKKVRFLKKLVKFTRPRVARKFPKWV
jgi:glycosyltransferase involved in cell wall biosynthesis